MKAPDKIYVGITDGKHYSIVGENYPFAKEYISKEKVMRCFDKCKENRKDISLMVSVLKLVEEEFNKFLQTAMTNAED